MGRMEAARAYYDSLRTELERWESPPPDRLAKASFGLGTGDRERAIDAARRWVEADPENDCGTYFGKFQPCPFLARVYAHFGEHDAAIAILEKILPAPSFLTVHILEIDPIWDPLREHPGFQALLEQYADDVEH